jgi:hypothetical protein
MLRSMSKLLCGAVLAFAFPGLAPAADRVAAVQFEDQGAEDDATAQAGRTEAGQVELATSDIAEGEATDAFEMGGIPGSQARQRRPGVGRAISGSGAWFNGGSPFGIKYGYGSGYGYGGYGFDNPYGYGPRTGGGGAYGFGFAPYGSVGGQTGERLSALISGPIEERGRLIGPEPPSIGAPARLDTAVGGTYGKAGAGTRKLGESASVSGRE